MQCPNDNSEMHEVATESHYGQNITLEQCTLCGGIWFDKLELHKIKQGEVEKIELVNYNKLQTSSKMKKEKLFCPKDKSELFIFKDQFFPKYWKAT